MVDVYLVSTSEDELAASCAAFSDVIGPLPGRAAGVETTLADGSALPAVPAAGEVGKFYACVRTPTPPVLPAAVSLCSEATGQAVCGVWG